jgi:hypothetical protein
MVPTWNKHGTAPNKHPARLSGCGKPRSSKTPFAPPANLVEDLRGTAKPRPEGCCAKKCPGAGEAAGAVTWGSSAAGSAARD